MLRFNPKGIVTVLGCSSAIALAGAVSLPRPAMPSSSGGYSYGCTNDSAPVSCTGDASYCGGTITFCDDYKFPGYSCLETPTYCTGNSFCTSLEGGCCDCAIAGPIAGK